MHDRQSILNMHRLPARLTVLEVALLLGFQEHDIAILIKAKLLKCLGTPAHNAPKYFSATEVENLSRNVDWLNKATKTISKNWRQKNDR